jgi:putative PIG3 family NAD(P)H quinone oxidoreductase
MQAIVITEPGGPEVLQLRDVPNPAPQRGEVLVKIHASAVNRADLIQRAGHYPAPPDVPKDIPGMEFAGEIAAVGEFAGAWKKGDRVFGLVGGGAYAQYVVLHSRAITAIPENLTYEEAAAMPEASITAYDAMVSQCKLKAGETVLIHGVASGVGTMAVQIANAIGARPIGTTRSDKKLDRLRELGLKDTLVTRDGRFAEKVKSLTASLGVDVILELIGGSYLAEDLHCVANQGRVAIVGLLAGSQCELNLGQLLSKRLQIFGTTLRARPLEQKLTVMQVFAKSLVPLIASGALKPIVDKTFSLKDAAAAHEYVGSNESFGKDILSVVH